MSVSFWCSAREGLAELFGEQAAHVGGRHVDGGRDDVHRPLMGQLHDVLAQVGLDRRGCRPPPTRGSSSISSLTIDFDLTTLLTLCSPGDVEHVLVGLGRVFGPQHRGAAGGDVPLELDQQLVEVGDGSRS